MIHVDYSQFQVELLVPEILLALCAFAILLYGAFSKPGAGRVHAGLLAFAGVVVSAAFAWHLRDVKAEAFYGAIRIDDFSQYLKVLILAAAGIVSLISIDYLRREDVQAHEYYALLLFAAVGMMLLVSSADLVSVLVSIEILSLSVYVLTGIRLGDSNSAEAALKYFILGAFASGVLVFGIALVYAATGELNLARLAAAVPSDPLLYKIGMGLILVGFAFKIAAAPFHMWAPDVYQGAPAPITGFMAVAVKAAGFAAALRVFSIAFAGQTALWQPIFWWLAVLTILVGNFMALLQDNLKRLLAYSSIAHAGYLLIGVAVGTKLSGAAILFYLASYAFMNLGAFAAITAVSSGSRERENLSDWGGMGYRHPMISAVMALCLFSLAGIPPMAGFFAKFYLFNAAVQAGDIPIVLIAVLGSLVSLYYYLKVIVVMYMRDPDASAEIATPHLAVRLAVLISGLGVLYLGILPGYILDWAGYSFASLF